MRREDEIVRSQAGQNQIDSRRSARRNNGRHAAFKSRERIGQLVAGRISRARILIRAGPIKARKPIAAREMERRRQGAERGVAPDAAAIVSGDLAALMMLHAPSFESAPTRD